MCPARPSDSRSSDRGRALLARSVEKDRGRQRGLKFQIDVDAMSVVRSDPCPFLIERESSLLASSHDFLQLGRRDAELVRGACSQQLIHWDPAAMLESEAEAMRLVAQMLAQILANFDAAPVVHRGTTNRSGRIFLW